MTIYSVYILSKAGGLIYQLDHTVPAVENEKTFSYPLELRLEVRQGAVQVLFGQTDGIRVGHVLTSINGRPVTGSQWEARPGEARPALEAIQDSSLYPISLKFVRPRLSTNEKIVQASMFYPLYCMAVQLSPVNRSSGILQLCADSFRLNCLQTLTGVKFMLVSDGAQGPVDALLRRLHELYADYALKNPFYSVDMPIRCDLFDSHLKAALDAAQRAASAVA